MKKTKSEPVLTQLNPSHPNHDSILLKQSRLEAYRRRRLENSGIKTPAPVDKPAGKKGKKPKSRGKTPARKG